MTIEERYNRAISAPFAGEVEDYKDAAGGVQNSIEDEFWEESMRGEFPFPGMPCSESTPRAFQRWVPSFNGDGNPIEGEEIEAFLEGEMRKSGYPESNCCVTGDEISLNVVKGLRVENFSGNSAQEILCQVKGE